MENEIRQIALDEIERNQEQCEIEGANNDRKQYTIGFNDGVLYTTKRVLEFIKNQSIYDHVKALRDFCEDSKGCQECPLHYKNNPLGCALENNVPCSWNLKEVEENMDSIESEEKNG